MGKYGDNSKNFYFDVNSPDGGSNYNYTFSINGNSVTTVDCSSDWHHIVATRSGTNISIYLNGVKSTDTIPIDSNMDNTGDLTIGYYNGNSFSGDIDDVKLYNYALTEAEVTDMYQEEKQAEIISITPASGSEVEASTDIVIVYSKELDNTTLGNIILGEGGTNINFINGTNCQITFETTTYPNDTIRVNPYNNLPGSSLMGININSFKDINGYNAQAVYLSSEYNIKIKGLVLYYPFTGNSNDESGNNHHATVSTTPTPSNRLSDNDCYLFNGIDFYFNTNINQLYTSGYYENTGDFTVCSWINANSVDSDLPIITKTTADLNTSEFALMIDGQSNTGNLSCIMGNGSTTVSVNAGDSTAQDIYTNTWYHVVFTINGNAMKLYINGALSGSSTFSGVRQSSVEQIHIGHLVEPPSYWNGMLDQIRIYNYALSYAEINFIYNLESTP